MYIHIDLETGEANGTIQMTAIALEFRTKTNYIQM
jgi:hypothetical protein